MAGPTFRTSPQGFLRIFKSTVQVRARSCDDPQEIVETLHDTVGFALLDVGKDALHVLADRLGGLSGSIFTRR